ncbi:DUF4238 domain-containing protein [Rhizobium sp. 268]|uniref:DUF4238 domain-containing protein n=1 Tax=Rhizobium sp. 268 TaxID=2996375 RepID=UPI002F925095
MSNNAPHRHHYVPRMVQRNFTNESGGLYFWRRGMNIGEVRITKPSNLFVEDHLYTIVDKNGARDARIASQADPMPDEMLVEFRNRGLVIYVAPSETSFILGDDMSGDALVSSRGGTTGARRVQFMPIAPDVAVGYCDTRGVHTDHLTAMDVRLMNEAMAKQSYLIAGRSKAQIASLSRIPYDPPEIMKGWFKSRHGADQ